MLNIKYLLFLLQSCNDNNPPCPIVLIERLGLELKKRFYETEIQILVSPSFLISSDTVVRSSKEKHLKQGHLLLSALQVSFGLLQIILIHFILKRLLFRCVAMQCSVWKEDH